MIREENENCKNCGKKLNELWINDPNMWASEGFCNAECSIEHSEEIRIREMMNTHSFYPITIQDEANNDDWITL